MTKDPKLKEAILEHGWALLNTQGRDAVQLRTLANLSDCSVGTIYNHYENLDEIILRLNMRSLNKMYDSLQNRLEEALKGKSNLFGTLKKMGEGYIAFGVEHPKLWASLFETIAIDPLPYWYQEHAERGWKMIEETLEQKFNLPEKRAEELVAFFWAAMHGITSIIIHRKMKSVGREVTKEFISSYMEHTLKGFID